VNYTGSDKRRSPVRCLEHRVFLMADKGPESGRHPEVLL